MCVFVRQAQGTLPASILKMGGFTLQSFNTHEEKLKLLCNLPHLLAVRNMQPI